LNLVNEIQESEIQGSLEWHSVLNAVLNVNIRAALPSLDQAGIMAYTDGACIKNPGGPAGWSALLWAAKDMVDGHVREGATCYECYGHIPKAPTTTNNRAEISAVLAVLSIAPPGLPLTIYSDSEYTINVAQGKFKMKANPDLWAIYRKLLGYRKQSPVFIWVQGHAGHLHNERADELAGLGAWNNDRSAFEKWQVSQTPEARTGLSSAQLVTMRQQAQRLKALFDTVALDSGRVSPQERQFVDDMVKRLQKNNFTPTEKQNGWLKGLAAKFKV
jgi:ribonuclease HI